MSLSSDSKLLSLILRHAPEKAGLTLSDGGWVLVADLLAGLDGMGHKIDLDRLTVIVDTNAKKRFTFSEDQKQIRAAQGHSVKVDMQLSAIAPPDRLYHGTALQTLDVIKRDGLKPMKRKHVHLSVEQATAVMVGARHGKPVVLTIKAKEMANDGHLFYCADNGVWLTDMVPNTYIIFQGGPN